MIRLKRRNPYSTHNIKVKVQEDTIMVYNDIVYGCVIIKRKEYGVQYAKRYFMSFVKNELIKQKINKKSYVFYECQK